MHQSRTVQEPLEPRQLFAAPAAVASFTLINADTDMAIGVIKAGDTLNLATLPEHLNVRADIAGGKYVPSVKLQLSGKAATVQNGAPFALFNDDHGDYFAGTFTPGSLTVTGTSYSAANATGTAAKPLSVSFKVVNQTTTPTPTLGNVTGLTLINAKTDAPLGALTNGTVVDAGSVDITQLSVRADSTGKIGSVKFTLDNTTHVEMGAPFSLFSNNGNDFFAGTIPVGTHTLTVTPYSAANAGGTAGTPVKVTFTVTAGTTPVTDPLAFYYDRNADGQFTVTSDPSTSELITSDDFDVGSIEQGVNHAVRYTNVSTSPVTLDSDILFDQSDSATSPSFAYVPLNFSGQPISSGTLFPGQPDVKDDDPNSKFVEYADSAGKFIVRIDAVANGGKTLLDVSIDENSGTASTRKPLTLAPGASIDLQLRDLTPGSTRGSGSLSKKSKKRSVGGTLKVPK